MYHCFSVLKYQVLTQFQLRRKVAVVLVLDVAKSEVL